MAFEGRIYGPKKKKKRKKEKKTCGIGCGGGVRRCPQPITEHIIREITAREKKTSGGRYRNKRRTQLRATIQHFAGLVYINPSV